MVQSNVTNSQIYIFCEHWISYLFINFVFLFLVSLISKASKNWAWTFQACAPTAAIVKNGRRFRVLWHVFRNLAITLRQINQFYGITLTFLRWIKFWKYSRNFIALFQNLVLCQIMRFWQFFHTRPNSPTNLKNIHPNVLNNPDQSLTNKPIWTYAEVNLVREQWCRLIMSSKAVITIAIRLRYDYDTTIPRRIRLRQKWSKLRFAFDSRDTS